jgi:4-hydroxybenzoyl-CoA thioesterase
VFFPNFSRWMDAASLMFFTQCGVPPWRELERERGIMARRCSRSTPSFSRP